MVNFQIVFLWTKILFQLMATHIRLMGISYMAIQMLPKAGNMIFRELHNMYMRILGSLFSSAGGDGNSSCS
jgi:hypothetical protein